MWNNKDWDESCFSAARVETALIRYPERSEALTERYAQANADLAKDLQPEALASLPRILITGTST
jgi:hypothetical protein